MCAKGARPYWWDWGDEGRRACVAVLKTLLQEGVLGETKGSF